MAIFVTGQYEFRSERYMLIHAGYNVVGFTIAVSYTHLDVYKRQGLQDIADIPVAMLEDTKTSTFHDLQAGAYSFSYTAGESDKRFLLHLGVSAVPENTKSETTVYSNLNTVYIQMKGQMQGNITIYNIAGQQVASRQAAPGLNEIKIQQAGNYICLLYTSRCV